MSGWAKQAANAEPGADQAPYLEPGNWELEGIYGKHITKFKGGEMLATRFRVVTTDNPKFKPGDEIDWCVNIKNGTPWHSNIKDFVAAIFAIPHEQVTEERLLALYPGAGKSSDLIKGMPIKCHAFNKETQQGADFTRVRWFKSH